jgi:tetratricopeptide (TPR) repeat protein
MARSAVGDTARALRDFASWARLDPDNLEAHRMAAEAALKVDRLDDALASVDRLIERQPEYEKGRAFQLRASIHVKRGSFEKALDDARRACDLGNVEGCKVIKDNRRTQEPAAPRKKGAKR